MKIMHSVRKRGCFCARNREILRSELANDVGYEMPDQVGHDVGKGSGMTGFRVKPGMTKRRQGMTGNGAGEE